MCANGFMERIQLYKYKVIEIVGARVIQRHSDSL
jgi:hypothetical protein